jgi:exonuclease VII large subunit
VGEENAMNQFNTSMRDARDKFNANMKFAIDQSNAQWRRQINTADTALQNETNRINVQNQYNLTQNALSQLWQKYRDNAAWNFQKSESALQRQHEIGVMAMEFANTKELYDKEMKDSIATGVGNWLGTWIREG